MGSFTDAITKKIRAKVGVYDQAYQRGILRVFNLIVQATPVDQGEHRRAWYIVKGTEAGPLYKDGGPGESFGVISEFKLGDPFTIYNAMGISAIVIEFGQYPNPGKEHRRRVKNQPAILTTPDGFSIQAPAGIIAPNKGIIADIFREEFANAIRQAGAA